METNKCLSDEWSLAESEPIDNKKIESQLEPSVFIIDVQLKSRTTSDPQIDDMRFKIFTAVKMILWVMAPCPTSYCVTKSAIHGSQGIHGLHEWQRHVLISQLSFASS